MSSHPKCAICGRFIKLSELDRKDVYDHSGLSDTIFYHKSCINPPPMPNKLKLTDELRQWYDWARAVSDRKGYNYFCSWWVSMEYGVDTPFVNRMMDRLVKLDYLTKESWPRLYTKYTFTNKEMNDAYKI